MKRISSPLKIALFLAFFIAAASAVTAQLPSDPELVYVRVTATEPTRNRPMRGLSKDQFKVFEDNAPQEIAYFSRQENIPLHVAIVVDVSGPTKDDVTRALSVMMRSGAQGDEFFQLESGKAPLNEAILQGIDALALRGNHGKHALLLVTSRKDPGSYPLAKVRERLKEVDIQLYVTALQTGSDVSADSDRQVVRELTERTGGNAYFPSSTFEQSDIFRKIVALLNSQYLIGYRSTNRATDGKWRKLKITGEYLDSETKKIKKMNLLVKPGYYSPTAAK